jgi:hypothetical protein
MSELEKACAGLMFPSESDFPFEVFIWQIDAPDLDERTLLRLTGHPAGAPVEQVDLDKFFQNVVADKDWHGETEKEQAGKFRNLLRALKDTLKDVRVYRVGKIEIDAYIVGRDASGRWAGLKTKLIET